jgi:RNA polymerase sigma-70 factor (ECF subfamily)
MIETNESLLGRLRIADAHGAWQEFFDAYWGAILRYGQKLGLSANQAEEVLQETMVVLMRILPRFDYDPRKGRFRNFLLTIVHRRALAVMERNSRRQPVVWSEVLEGDLADPFGNSESAEREARDRWRDSLLEEAIRRLREDPRLAEKTLAIFEAYVINRQPATEVARRFEVSENAVYQIRNRLLRRLKAEVGMLMKSGGMG